LAVYAVGDVQGCRDELVALLDLLRFDAAVDRLWLTGDLVNRGPDSLGTLRLVRDLGAAAVTVLGNHDLHLLAVACGHGAGRQDNGTLQVLAAPDGNELVEWLLGRPLLHVDRDLGWSMVHAGLPPAWDLATAEACAREVESALAADPGSLFAGMYGDEPQHWSPSLAGIARYRFTINCMTRLRYVDASGRVLLRLKGPPRDAPPGAIPWFRHPARATAAERIVFGHWSTLGLHREDGALCLDGGCVWGGRLCALRLDAEAAPVTLDCAGHRRPGAG
jgi:bis(5'-nucleosyl)-tetraphosphatase (symmetrical)